MKHLIAFIFFLVVTASLVPGQSSSKSDAALVNLIKQMTDAQLAYDVPALDRIFTSDYIEISPVGEFDPRDKVLGFYKPELKPSGVAPKLEISEHSFRSYGKIAIVIVKLTYTMTVDGKVMPPRNMRATFVCRQEKGLWKIASAQYTGIRPPQPAKN